MKKLLCWKEYNQTKDRPVFTLDNGKFLTVKTLNITLQNLLEKHIGSEAENISGKSFIGALLSGPEVTNTSQSKTQ